ncbi:hypothetical protein CISG_05272 [Coccidioides immitis RMSCC 3703]|uniref:Uncharacterized protein n=1 Tax=Coccidioides immitis RMSCC 3703 TaxID=454286 RepID=A0A0J8QXB8_COCIT|nr:hypothetical protein CISG_05272 [Coccidioides immitis RMSCC 3703]
MHNYDDIKLVQSIKNVKISNKTGILGSLMLEIVEVDWHDYASIVNDAIKMRFSCLPHLDQGMEEISPSGNCFVIEVDWHGHASIVNGEDDLLWCKLFGLVFEFKIMSLLLLLIILKRKCFMLA